MARALSGKTVAVTRPRRLAGGLARALEARGARVVCAPLIKVVPPESYAALDRAIRGLDGYDWVIFTSQNGVNAFFARLKRTGSQPLKRPRLAAVGRATAAALGAFGFQAEAVPSRATGARLARELPLRKGERVLVPRAKKGGEDLPAILRRRGAKVTLVAAYRTVADERGAARVRALAERGALDAVTFTSGSTAEHLRRALGAARFRKLFRTAAAASIGPVTTAALRRYGARPVQARAASDEALAAALEAHFA